MNIHLRFKLVPGLILLVLLLFSPTSHATTILPRVFIIQDDGTIIQSGTSESDVGIISYETISSRRVAEKFYATHSDIYDFLIIYTAFQPKTQIPSNEIIKSTISGIGLQVLETIPPYPSARLVQSIFASNIDNFNPNNPDLRMLFEEISHRWLTYIGDVRDCKDPSSEPCRRKTGFKINRDGGHWDENVDGLVRENGKIYSPPQSASGNPWQENNGYCTTLAIDFPLEVRLNSLELYLMGFLPPAEVQPLNWYEFGEWTSKGRKCTKRVLTVNDVINMSGPRNPSYQNVERDLSAAFILITKQGQTSIESQINKINFIAEIFPQKWNIATQYKSTINGVRVTPVTPAVIPTLPTKATAPAPSPISPSAPKSISVPAPKLISTTTPQPTPAVTSTPLVDSVEIESEKISEYLIEKGVVDTVKAVERVEQKERIPQVIYRINGHKKVKLLFIIPVIISIDVDVSAGTGRVMKVNKPWWSFLTR